MKPIDVLTNEKHSECLRKSICTFCGKEAKVFRDALSKKEYQISGFCQTCQDKVFGKCRMINNGN
jgi:hypothetical protein